MKGNMLTIARKELAKFFSNRVSALVSIVLPGLLIFVLWSFMGSAMQDMFSPDEDVSPVVGVVNEPASVRALAQDSGIRTVPEEALPDADAMRERIDAGEVQAFAAFPAGLRRGGGGLRSRLLGEPAPQVEDLLTTRPTADSAAAAYAASRGGLLDGLRVVAGEPLRRERGGGAPTTWRRSATWPARSWCPSCRMLLLILLFSSVHVHRGGIGGRREGARHHGDASRPRPSAGATSRSASSSPSRSSAF